MKIYHLQVNHMDKPYVEKDIEFSWRIKSDDNNVLQTYYQIDVYKDKDLIWTSDKVKSRKQSFIKYEGNLKSKTKYKYVITIWDNYDNVASASSTFESGLLNINEWKAKFVESPFERNPIPYFTNGIENPVLNFTKTFKINNSIKSAKLYITAYGCYRPLINGKRIDDREFAPEFTPYDRVLNYQIYDIKNLLEVGRNKLDVMVGDGWYFNPQTEVVTSLRHEKPSIIFQLEIETKKGEKITICSDGSEVVCQTNILYSDLFMGEKIDLSKPYSKYEKVIVKYYDKSILRLQPLPPIKTVEVLHPKKIITSENGETIIDFGQNIAGRCKIEIEECKGTELKFEHCEVLDKNGNYISLFPAAQTDIVITNGKKFIYEPTFTFHGFRYIKVTGMQNVTKERFTALLLSTEKENAATFKTDNKDFNRLYSNIRYSQKNNMMSIPTDCPTREKAGWTGDISIYCKTAIYNENMTPFLTSWVEGLTKDQLDNGVVPIISPYTKMYDFTFNQVSSNFKEAKRIDVVSDIKNANGDEEENKSDLTSVAGWSDAILDVPYNMYKLTGNKLILERNYQSMKKFIDNLIKTANDRIGTNLDDEYEKYLWDTGFHFGEWLIPDHNNNGFNDCKETSLYCSAFFGYRDVKTFSEIAQIVNKKDAPYYLDIAEKMKNAIQHGLIDNNKLPNIFQGMYVLAFAFDLVDERHYDEYKNRLVELIEEYNNCLQTGFLATPYLFDALEKIGRKDLIKTILWQKRCPSWLYEVEMGATSIWENWSCYEEDGQPKRSSFDHYAYGVIDNFFMEKIAGIKSDTVGFSHFIVEPDTSYGFNKVERSFISEAGKISVSYNENNIKVTVPENTTATIKWKNKFHKVGSGTYTF